MANNNKNKNNNNNNNNNEKLSCRRDSAGRRSILSSRSFKVTSSSTGTFSNSREIIFLKVY